MNKEYNYFLGVIFSIGALVIFIGLVVMIISGAEWVDMIISIVFGLIVSVLAIMGFRKKF